MSNCFDYDIRRTWKELSDVLASADLLVSTFPIFASEVEDSASIYFLWVEGKSFICANTFVSQPCRKCNSVCHEALPLLSKEHRGIKASQGSGWKANDGL